MNTIRNLFICSAVFAMSAAHAENTTPPCEDGCAPKVETLTMLPPATFTEVPPACENTTMAMVESASEKFNDAKQVLGYIRTPQSFALKLVNDHVVKIPAWVGYAVDPVGSVKNRVLGEARDRARSYIKDHTAIGTIGVNSCTPAPVAANPDASNSANTNSEERV